MSSTAFKRLMQEYKELTLNSPEGLTAGPTNEDNFFEWDAVIMGPEGTYYEGGCFTAKLAFPRDYPLNPPKMTFTVPMAPQCLPKWRSVHLYLAPTRRRPHTLREE